MTIAGSVMNDGTIRVIGGAAFHASGTAASFTSNPGVLDLITTGNSTLCRRILPTDRAASSSPPAQCS